MWLAAWLALVTPAGRDSEILIVDFAPLADPEVAARELCLRAGCTVLHVYRYLPGAAVTGAPAGLIARSPGVTGVAADQAVRLATGYRLIGAPSHAPLAVVAGGLDAARLVLEQRRRYHGEPAARATADTTALVAALAERMPGRVFWSFSVVNDRGGRLSDVLAALDDLVGLRFAVAAVYAPLTLAGAPPARLCRTIDDVLRRGLVVVTELDAGCGHGGAGGAAP
jgi:hypothetical protein